MTAYNFKHDRAARLYSAAQPKGHITAFAWREEPARLDKFWGTYTKGMSEEDQDELLKSCILAGDAQTRYRKDQQTAGDRLVRPKGIAVWFNAGGWGEEIGSHADLKQKHEGKYCSVEGCPDLTHGPRFEYCAHHLNFTIDGKFKDVMMAEELREFYTTHKDLPFMEDKSEVMKWVRARIVEIGKPGP